LFFFFLVLDPVPNLNGELVAVYLHAPRLGRGLSPKEIQSKENFHAIVRSVEAVNDARAHPTARAPVSKSSRAVLCSIRQKYSADILGSDVMRRAGVVIERDGPLIFSK
jgi:hypothetical protein